MDAAEGARAASEGGLGDWVKLQLVESLKTTILIGLDLATTLIILGGLGVISLALKYFSQEFGFSDVFQQFFHGAHEVVSLCMYSVLSARSVNHLSRGFFGVLLNRFFKV